MFKLRRSPSRQGMAVVAPGSQTGSQRMKVDIHSHFFPRIAREEAARLDSERARWWQVDGRDGQIMQGNQHFRPVRDVLWNSQRRVDMLDAQNIDIQVMCATPVMFGYEQPIERALPWAELMH